jgi:hypothetical protein
MNGRARYSHRVRVGWLVAVTAIVGVALVLAVNAAATPATTVLRLDGIGPLRLGMSRVTALEASRSGGGRPRGETRQKVIGYVRAHPGATASEVAGARKLSRTAVATRLVQLVKAGELAKAPRGYSASCYVAATARRVDGCLRTPEHRTPTQVRRRSSSGPGGSRRGGSTSRGQRVTRRSGRFPCTQA